MVYFNKDERESNGMFIRLWTHVNSLIVIFVVWWFRFMVFNATFSNISVISWQSVLLVEEIRVHGKTTNLSQIADKLYHKMIFIKYTTSWVGFELTTLVVIGTDSTGSCKSNYNIITATTAPKNIKWKVNLIIDQIVETEVNLISLTHNCRNRGQLDTPNIQCWQ